MMSGDVNVRITATDQASGAFRAVSAEAVKFGAVVGAASSLTQRAFDGLVFASTQLMRSVIADANAFHDMSERSGIAIDKLAAFKLVADQSGTSIGSIANGIRALSKAMAENGERFRSVGIDTTDAHKAFRQLADIFAKLPEGPERTALYLKLFNEAGNELVPVLKRGSKGLDEALEKTRAYSDAITKLAPELDKYNKAMAEVGVNLKASAAALATGFTSDIVLLSEKLVTATRDADGFKKVLAELAALTGGPTSIFSAMSRGVDAYYLLGGGGDPSKRTSRGIIGGRLAAPGGNSPDELAARKAACTLTGGMWDAARNTCVKKEGSQSARISEGAQLIRQLTERLIREDELTEVQRLQARIAQDLIKFDNSRQQSAALALAGRIDAEKEWEAAVKAATAEAILANDEWIRATEQSRQRIESLYAATGAGQFDKMIADMQFVERAFANGLIDHDKLDAITASLMGANLELKHMRSLGEELGLTFTSAFESAIFSGQDLRTVLAGLLQDMMKIIVRQQVFEPWAKSISNFDFGSLFGGFKAEGGPVSSGMAYIVGERGPELFVPPVAGNIVPNNRLASAAAAPQQNIRIVNAFDTSVIGDYLASAAGERVIMNAVQRNPSAFRQMVLQ